VSPLSGRYAAWLLAAALVAAVPVALHSLSRLDRDDCADPGAFRVTLLIPGSQPVAGDRTLPRRMLQRSLGSVDAGLRGTPALEYAIVRSFEPIRLVQRPARFVVRRFDAQSQELVWTERGGERLPIHWTFERTRSLPQFVAYFFVYGSRPVAHPLLALVGSAPARLVTGARPLTLVAIAGQARPGELDALEKVAEDWLFAAWAHYRAVCRGSP
jgi:hypothetical protein